MSIGPSLIFDKSAFQSLNPDESLWLDQFYLTNITPLFFVETLADLEKETQSGKTPEQIVGSLAYKTPEMGCVNTHCRSLLLGELTGQGPVEMSGRPCISGGQAVMLGGETGIIFRETEEMEAFKRWKEGKFFDVERLVAKKWREELATSNEESIFRQFHDSLTTLGSPRSFSDVKMQVDSIINSPFQKEILISGLTLIGIMPDAQEKIIKQWINSGKKPIKDYAPYFTYILSVDLFFGLSNAANLLKFRHPQTHRIDLAYLYYLPFCKIFVSNDNFHINIAPLFLRPDQTFIKGSDLKDDLSKLDRHYSSFPDEIKNRGVFSFAFCPPGDTAFLTTRLWDKYMAPTWRNIQTKKFDGTDKVDPKMEEAMREKIKKFTKEAIPINRNIVGNSDKAGNLIVKHMVSKRKGKWRKFPPEVKNSKPIMD